MKNKEVSAVSTCYRCQPGYSLTYIDHSITCQPAKFTGCMENSDDRSRCQACDIYEGYSMQPDFSCRKVGQEGSPSTQFF